MKIISSRDVLLKPLSFIGSVVERRQTLPILSNVHLRLEAKRLSLTGTDLEVELIAGVDGVEGGDGECTVAARKLLDICRALPEDAQLEFSADGDKALIRSGRSRFTLQTLPAGDFPRLEADDWAFEATVSQGELKGLFDRIGFAMAQQDVRYYLNGTLIDIRGATMVAVATDGHRLARSEIKLDSAAAERHSAIVPRKAVQELGRLLEYSDEPVKLQMSQNHVRAEFGNLVFTSKLIDGRYPDYEKVVPSAVNVRLALEHDRFRDTLHRASILTNEKFRGVRITLSEGLLKAVTTNPDQEEAVDEMPIAYDGEEMEVGFNVGYLLDAIHALGGDEVEFALKDANSSCILRTPGTEATFYLVMPMRL